MGEYCSCGEWFHQKRTFCTKCTKCTKMNIPTKMYHGNVISASDEFVFLLRIYVLYIGRSGFLETKTKLLCFFIYIACLYYIVLIQFYNFKNLGSSDLHCACGISNIDKYS